MGRPRQKVGRGRGNQNQVGLAREIDMRHRIRHARIPLVGENRLAGKRLEGRRCYKMRRPLGHRHLHVGALLAEQANQFGRLVGGDAAGDAENDALSL